MAMKHFTSTATKDGRWWVVQCDQEPGALSQVARLDQAADHQREAIAMILDLDEADIDVEVTPVLSGGLSTILGTARTARAEADLLNAQAAERIRTVAAELVEQQYSLRDIGAIIGVSHQRVAQLLDLKAAPAKSGAVPRMNGSRVVKGGAMVDRQASRSAKSGKFVDGKPAAKSGRRRANA